MSDAYAPATGGLVPPDSEVVMKDEFPVQFSDLIICFSRAVDLVSPIVADHHRRVASIALSLARETGLADEKIRDLALAGALHDVGGLSLAMRINAMQFEVQRPHEHAVLGYLLLKTFRPFEGAAAIVRLHHVDWEHGAGAEFYGEQVPFESYLLHLADRVAILLRPEESVLAQSENITRRISEQSERMFPPDLVSAFARVAQREFFWLDALNLAPGSHLEEVFGNMNLKLGQDLFGLTRLLCRVIDFRSHFTSSHTSGVAACAVALSELAGFSEYGRRQMMIAGFIHDLGKLAVPTEILEKPSALTREEYDIIRTHAYHTDHILRQVRGFDTIRKWGALHHERLDGKGYPYHLTEKDLPLGSRIMSVADVFVALTEDRPYRKGMARDDVLRVLERMVQRTALDSGVVALLEARFDEINEVRIAAQNEAEKEYIQFVRQAGEILERCGAGNA
jgi:HD-GYP domain-containing protein (c-di-GMP phosphodiesterase class II)